jgi:two-component system, cell cycle sensor histidine kinase and response regulator CckA
MSEQRLGRDAAEQHGTEDVAGGAAHVVDVNRGFEKAFRVSPHALCITDFATGELLEVNDAYVRTSGYSREQLLGHTVVELGLITAEQRELYWHGRTRSGVRDIELPFTNARGESRIGLASADLVDLGGRLCAVMGLLDITEQRRMETAKALLEDQLRQVQKLEAIGTLAGGIAHDFNNILGAMLGYTEVAKLEAAGVPEALESLAEVLHAGQRAKELVRRILTFSRRHAPERRPVRLQPVVDETHRLLRSTLPSTIELRLSISPGTERVHADPTQMHQVLVNLATNAAHAMQNKVGAITIQLANHEVSSQTSAGRIPNLRPGKYVELAVKDDGCGMDAATLERIFEPFFTTKTPGDGTGLGLSVVHGIVTEHEGIIHVASEPGVGSSFHVLLPAFSGTTQEDVADEPAVLHGNGERILFIDDEPTLCNAAQKLLGTLSYVVTVKTNAAAALQQFRADPTAFDLVITDLTMPGLTGVDVAAQVLLARPGMPVILATGFNANWTLDAIRKLGIHDIVLKPLSLAALSATIRSALLNRA